MSPGLRTFLQGAVRSIGVSAVVLGLSTPAVIAESNTVYRWVDPVDHSIHFSTTPPAGVTAESVAIKPVPADSETQQRLEQMGKNVDKAIKTREQQAGKRKQEAAKAAKRKRECEQARDKLARFETHEGRMVYKDKSGQMQRMPEQLRQKGIANLKERIKEACSPGA